MDLAPEARIPAKSRGTRACLLCSLIQTSQDFRTNGCPNCEDILQLRGNQDRILSCTSQYWDGMVALIDPDASWVARWQRTSKYVRGVYAVRVRGRIPDEIEHTLEDRGITYRPRDGSEQD